MKGNSLNLILAISLISLSFACPNDPLCLQCRNSLCTLCANSYPNSAGVCTAVTTALQGCYIYSSATTCARCNDGYFFNSAAGTCTILASTIIDVCRYSTKSISTCSHCKFGVVQNGGGCSPMTFCQDPNCETCALNSNGIQSCTLCKPGFSLWTGVTPSVCVFTPSLANCDQILIPNYCDVCTQGYSWQNGVCNYSKGTFQGIGKLGIISLSALVAMFLRY